MSQQQQPRYEEDLPMEDAIVLRDQRTFVAQTQQRHIGTTRDTPITDLWESTREARLHGQRRLRDRRETSPYRTPTRGAPWTRRPSEVREEAEISDESSAPSVTPDPFLTATVRREVQRQGGPVVQGLHQGVSELAARTQFMPIIQDLITQHERRIEETNRAHQALVSDLQTKFATNDGNTARIVTALQDLNVRLQTQAGTQTKQLNDVVTHLTTTATAQYQRQEAQTQALVTYVNQLKETQPAVLIPSEVTEALKRIEEAKVQDQEELTKAREKAEQQVLSNQKQIEKLLLDMGRVTGKGKARQAAVEDGSEEGGRAPPPPPPLQSTPPPPADPPYERSQREVVLGGQGGGQGGKGGGRGRPGGSNPDPSDSSDSEDERRRRADKDRRRRARRWAEMLPPPVVATPATGETPKQAKIPFAGKPDQDVRHWIDQMEILIDLQKKVRWDDKTKILWASLELQGSAASFWRNYKERLGIEPELGTWEAFKRELRIQYGNRTSQEQAKQKMDRLRQSGPIDDYINEMQNLEWDAQVGPIVMKSMILAGINSSLETRLSAAIEEPSSFPAWLAWVRKVGRKDAEVKARREILRGKEREKPRDPQPSRRQQRSEQRPRRQQAETTQHPPPSGSLGATQDEKDRWQKENKCLRCGREGHIAKNCFATSKVRFTSESSGGKRKRDDTPSGRKDSGRGSEKKRKLGSQAETFRSRITSLEEE